MGYSSAKFNQSYSGKQMNNKDYTDAVNNKEYPSENIVPLDPPFVDDRGHIQNLLNTNVSGAAVIISKKGSIRSNHYHREDWHYLYVISGSMRYLEQDAETLSEDWEKDFIVKAGEMVFTPPMKIHRTVFLEDTVMISLSKRNRDHDSHEEDVVRVEL